MRTSLSLACLPIVLCALQKEQREYMRDLPLRGLWVFLLVALATSHTYAQPTPDASVDAGSRPVDELTGSEQLTSRTRHLEERLARMLKEAQTSGDAPRANCISRKLTELKAYTQSMEQRIARLRAAQEAQDNALSKHEATALAVISSKVDTLNQEASQCLGESVYEPGASQVVTTVPAGSKHPNYAIVRIFYGTDRERENSDIDYDYYGKRRKRSPGLWLGTADVSIPRDHRMGRMERPAIWKFEFSDDPNQHISIVDIKQRSYGDFYGLMSSRVSESQRREILVFVHGFSVGFDDAVRRAAQIAYDISFDGAPVLYSWPSQASVSSYTIDENNAAWTVPHFLSFLHDLSVKTGAKRIHVVAHSMGNRPVVETLYRLSRKPAYVPLANVLFMAPDVDADTFRALVNDIRRPTGRLTLYASQNDRALGASHLVHGYSRAGDAGPEIILLPGMDTIDASAADTSLLGHSYYGDKRSILGDIFYLIRHDLAAAARQGLRAIQTASGPLYRYLP